MVHTIFLREVMSAEQEMAVALLKDADEGEERIRATVGAWITTAARHKAIDRLCRQSVLDRKKVDLKIRLERAEVDVDADEIPDERLKLIFTCCHPALAKEAQVALTLQALGDLTTPEIASAFLATPTTMAQRLVRTKRKIRDTGIPYRVPPTETISERLDAVLSVLYLIFNAGYTSLLGDSLIRHDLCAEAIWLACVLTTLLAKEPSLPEDAEALGLLALMLLHDSRRKARVTPDGALIHWRSRIGRNGISSKSPRV